VSSSASLPPLSGSSTPVLASAKTPAPLEEATVKRETKAPFIIDTPPAQPPVQAPEPQPKQVEIIKREPEISKEKIVNQDHNKEAGELGVAGSLDPKPKVVTALKETAAASTVPRKRSTDSGEKSEKPDKIPKTSATTAIPSLPKKPATPPPQSQPQPQPQQQQQQIQQHPQQSRHPLPRRPSTENALNPSLSSSRPSDNPISLTGKSPSHSKIQPPPAVSTSLKSASNPDLLVSSSTSTPLSSSTSTPNASTPTFDQQQHNQQQQQQQQQQQYQKQRPPSSLSGVGAGGLASKLGGFNNRNGEANSRMGKSPLKPPGGMVTSRGSEQQKLGQGSGGQVPVVVKQKPPSLRNRSHLNPEDIFTGVTLGAQVSIKKDPIMLLVDH
jgi:hypothetical protein